jgi:DNA polymerase-3 subunit delta'
MFFRDVIGHQEIGAQLRAAVQSNRVAHAFLFDGPEGCGALGLARAYARYLHCLEPVANDACGSCESCKAHDSMQHPDLHWSFPFFKGEKSDTAVSQPFQATWRKLLMEQPHFGLEEWVEAIGADKKQLFISVHEALEINRKLGLKSFKGGRKILICWLPETMRVDTANKMLKLIEEPTDGTVMLFVSEHMDQLLATIRSRVQAVKVPRLNEADAASTIERMTGMDAAAAAELAGVVDGNLASALRLAAAGGAAPDHELFVSWMRACWGLKGAELLEQSDQFAKPGREAMKRFLIYALHMVRQCIVGNYGAMDAVRLTGRERAFAEKFAPFIHHGNVVEMQQLIEAAHRDIAGNVNGKLVFLDLSNKLHALLKRTA